ncbi:hypothetical protein [Abyssogena phaseoliformis symbiont]|uniref:hypothetical protein n=1 Tax=Abyssogena phaseoliformis symbiont TaxID=596095 RepID=UPI001915E919|nr:hypothetical protein [Abyssogena phaseoliformis symbiont]
MTVNAVSTAIRKYIKHNEGHEHFVLKDLRRTCKRLMVDAMISRETRNLIQGHGLTSIDLSIDLSIMTIANICQKSNKACKHLQSTFKKLW